METKKSVQEERGTLSPGAWVTIYAHAENKTFFVQLFGSIPKNAKMDVEIDGSVHGTLTQGNPSMHANGKKIRLHNVAGTAQGYNYFPV